MIKYYIIGNWKMNGSSAFARGLIKAIADNPASADVTTIICPPFTLLSQAKNLIGKSKIFLGAQDCHQNDHGAHTGDISAPMLRDCGVEYVILGHSERRAEHHENNDLIKQKSEAAERSALIPIICVGESRTQYETRDTAAVLTEQLSHSLPEQFNGLIAYEPIWAIGTRRIPSYKEILKIHTHIRHHLINRFGEDRGKAYPLLYGGSVSDNNASIILNLPNINGILVGGASLKADTFLAILQQGSSLALSG